MYQIYLDTYFFLNFWMNLWVLFLCRFLVHSKVKKRRVFLGALAAAVGEVLVLCVPLGNSRVKIIMGFGGITAILIYWLFSPKTREYFYRLLIYSYLAAGVLGGSLIFLELVLSKHSLSLPVACSGIVVATKAVTIVYKKFCSRNEFGDVELILSENSKCTIRALIDSGNGLVEPISQKPVSIVEKSVMDKFKNDLTKENFRIVPFHSVGKEKGILEAYFIEKLEIRRSGESIVVERPMIAIAEDEIASEKGYQMILHPALLEN